MADQMAKQYIMVFLVFFLPTTLCVLPPYIPTIDTIERPRDIVIQQYFKLGLDYVEILAFLALYHGIHLSLRQLKRIFKERNLSRRKNQSNPMEVINAIEMEIKGSGSCVGYRQMHQLIRSKYSMVTSREIVRMVLKELDPVGVENRSSHKLRRRQYFAKGPNYIWHLDGYDKLKPFGFCIHGAIDGYSRRILWLEVGSSNNNPNIVAKYYIDCVRQLSGVPRIVRGDCGTENGNIAHIQRFVRAGDDDAFAGEKSFLYGKSVSNQRIEAWWSHLRKSNSDWWINFFKQLRESGQYNDNNPMEVECLKFCFMPIIQEELYCVAKLWNTHRIRKCSNPNSPNGIPDVLYFLPETTDTQCYKVHISEDDIEIADEICCEESLIRGCSQDFNELATMVMEDGGLTNARNANEALNLYLSILSHLNNLS